MASETFDTSTSASTGTGRPLNPQRLAEVLEQRIGSDGYDIGERFLSVREVASPWNAELNRRPSAVAGFFAGGQTGIQFDNSDDLLLRTNGTDAQSNLAVSTFETYVGVITHSGNNVTIDLADTNGSSSSTAVLGSALNLTLSRGLIGNMVEPNHGDFPEARFDGYIGRVQIYDTALDSAARSQLVSDIANLAPARATAER